LPVEHALKIGDADHNAPTKLRGPKLLVGNMAGRLSSSS
jgi:hypothetical protein